MNHGYITLNNAHLVDDTTLSSISSFYFAKKSFKQETAEKFSKVLQSQSLPKAIICTFGITHTRPVTVKHCVGDYHLHIDALTHDVVMTSRGKSIDTGNIVFEGSLSCFVARFIGDTE